VVLERRGDEGLVRPGVRFLVAPKRLAAKLGGRFEPRPERLDEARDKLQAWQREFVVTAENYLARAEACFAEIESTRDAALRHRGLADLNRISDHLHGYGRSFGFPLVITLSRSLQQLTGQAHEADSDCLQLVRAHLDALQAVLQAGLCPAGGKIGRKLVQELPRANRKMVSVG
jgi:hypothetical protein